MVSQTSALRGLYVAAFVLVLPALGGLVGDDTLDIMKESLVPEAREKHPSARMKGGPALLDLSGDSLVPSLIAPLLEEDPADGSAAQPADQEMQPAAPEQAAAPDQAVAPTAQPADQAVPTSPPVEEVVGQISQSTAGPAAEQAPVDSAAAAAPAQMKDGAPAAASEPLGAQASASAAQLPDLQSKQAGAPPDVPDHPLGVLSPPLPPLSQPDPWHPTYPPPNSTERHDPNDAGWEGWSGVLLILLPVFCALPAVIWFIQYIICGEQEDLSKQIQKSSVQITYLDAFCEELAQRLRMKIEDLVQKQIDWSQHDFNHKLADFVAFLEYCRGNPTKFGGNADNELAELLRTLVATWMKVFRECSRDPLNQPFDLISEQELEWTCPRGFIGTASWVLAKVRGQEVEFIGMYKPSKNKTTVTIMPRRLSSWKIGEKNDPSPTIAMRLEKAKNPGSEKPRVEGCLPGWLDCCGVSNSYLFVPRDQVVREVQDNKKDNASDGDIFPFELMLFCNCIKVNFISPMHLILVVYFIAAIPLSIWLFRIPYIIGSALIWVILAMLFVILYRWEKIDTIKHMRNEEEALAEEKTALQKIQIDLDAFYKNVDTITAVWTCRTRPRLEIFKQIMRKVTETRWSNVNACKAFLRITNENLTGIEANIGDMDYYMGSTHLLSKDGMSLVKAQLDRVANIIRLNDAKDVVQKAKEIMLVPNLLGVRILACHKLPAGTVFTNYNPYVRMRVRKEGDWVKTACHVGETNPRWHSEAKPVEFRFMVEGRAKELTCQVMDEHFGYEDTFMGELRVQIETLQTGKWVKLSKVLDDPVDHVTPGKLDIEVFLVRKASDLYKLMPATKAAVEDSAGAKLVNYDDSARPYGEGEEQNSGCL